MSKVAKVKVFKDDAGEWRWTAFGANGERIATSGEGYKKHSHAVEMADDLFGSTGVAVATFDGSHPSEPGSGD